MREVQSPAVLASPAPLRCLRPAPRRVASVESLEPRSLLSVVLPGGTVALAGTTAAARPELAGTVVRDALIPFSVSDGVGHTIFKGTLQDRVVRETRAGTLDFYQTVRADAGFAVPAILDYVVRSSFGGVSTDVDYRTDGLGSPTVKPEQASRSTDGKSVRFAFNFDRLVPGAQSRFYFVKTNAKAFDLQGSTAVGFGQGPISGSGNGSAKLTTAEPVRAPTGSISGVKYNDVNGNGHRDANEPALRGWTIYLDANGNKKLDPGEPKTTTDASGYYKFANLPAGNYRVREVLKSGWRQTQPAASVYNVPLAGGATVNNENFGNTKSVLIVGAVRAVTGAPLAGFRVYIDANGNKKLDAGETFVVTAASGAFQFSGLAANPAPAAPYAIRVMTLPGYTVVSPASGVFPVNLASGGVSSLLTFVAWKQ